MMIMLMMMKVGVYLEKGLPRSVLSCLLSSPLKKKTRPPQEESKGRFC